MLTDAASCGRRAPTGTPIPRDRQSDGPRADLPPSAPECPPWRRSPDPEMRGDATSDFPFPLLRSRSLLIS